MNLGFLNRFIFRPNFMALSDRPYGPVGRGAGIPPVALNAQATASGQQSSTLPVVANVVGTAETQILSGPVPQLPLSCAIPPATALEQTVFDVWVSGNITTKVTGTLAISLYEGDNTVIADNVKLGTTGAVNQIGSQTTPFYLHARLIYDSVGGLMCGTVEGYINKTAVAAATLLNFPIDIDNDNSPVATFSLTATCSTASPTNPVEINIQKFTCG
jgi:hypothetical protein